MLMEFWELLLAKARNNMILGFDTSNYTTSVALFDTKNKSVTNLKKLLPVKQGELGLRQSDAVYHHVQQLHELIAELDANVNDIKSIGVSVRPRNVDGSYMPCFSVGYSFAKSFASLLNVPLFEFSHQEGHIGAALYSADKLDLIERDFIAFHFSGGTSEALYCKKGNANLFDAQLISASLDLKAGQAIDRVGVALGLNFPAGAELDKLSANSEKSYKIKPSFVGDNPSFSGLENKCNKMIKNGEKPCDIAKFAIEYVYSVVERMTHICAERFGDLPLIYSGGVMSNSYISAKIKGKFNAYFAKPEFSSDNAAGIAVLTAYRSGLLD